MGNVVPLTTGRGSRDLGSVRLTKDSYMYFRCAGEGAVTVNSADLTAFTSRCAEPGAVATLEPLKAGRYPTTVHITVNAPGALSWVLTVDTTPVEFPR